MPTNQPAWGCQENVGLVIAMSASVQDPDSGLVKPCGGHNERDSLFFSEVSGLMGMIVGMPAMGEHP